MTWLSYQTPPTFRAVHADCETGEAGLSCSCSRPMVHTWSDPLTAFYTCRADCETGVSFSSLAFSFVLLATLLLFLSATPRQQGGKDGSRSVLNGMGQQVVGDDAPAGYKKWWVLPDELRRW